ncbi:hypothetical protein ACOJUR_12695 [Alicyclobacillus tolerans]|uniref:Spore coat protein n=2 Tax=Alicyclobacillus tolerans TaxID=90970 RepID=A0ABT9LSI5_9BACL|nr:MULTISPECIES: hypothetical protein [Alicyclobacillus]MDP9727226.1 hypothetical protein [Alicyclobacillus tengchongensis]QRF22986.1 hypothetical protein FY534_04300 [Alicyclobacillus sp. TC]SHJ57667.1 hypothetical protein SAMN05443507_101234 [Alicyclobacillus montanus]
MQPLTAKELEYIVDSMSNEDLLLKQSVIATGQAKSQVLQNFCNQLQDRHARHYQHLLDVLQQHAPLAPSQSQR